MDKKKIPLNNVKIPWLNWLTVIWVVVQCVLFAITFFAHIPLIRDIVVYNTAPALALVIVNMVKNGNEENEATNFLMLVVIAMFFVNSMFG